MAEDDLRMATPEEIEELKAKCNRLSKLLEEDKKAIRKLLRDIQRVETYVRWEHVLGINK